jgi:hypothetical protein
MKHQSKPNTTNAQSTSLSTLWHLIRDELVSETLVLDSKVYVELRKGFEEVIGPETIQERKKYKRTLSIEDRSGHLRNYIDLAGSAYHSESVIMYCHWKILRNKVFGDDSVDPFILTSLDDNFTSAPLWTDIDWPPLDQDFGNLPELVKRFNGATPEHERQDDLLRIGCNLILYTCIFILSTSVLKAVSICQGLRRAKSHLTMTRLRGLLLQVEKSFQCSGIGSIFHSQVTNTLNR